MLGGMSVAALCLSETFADGGWLRGTPLSPFVTARTGRVDACQLVI